jgi:superfamily I DNA/RNA helicase
MPRVPQDQWRPSGIDDLEPAAWAAVRAIASTCVIAGPGAGKTELLAQRATFLLETGACPSPSRILAISFKRDAAANLRARVEKRCPPHLSRRFASVTFDAFAKGIVDRFSTALPPRWSIPDGYHRDIAVFNGQDVVAFLGRHSNCTWAQALGDTDPKTFESTVLGRWRLPAEKTESPTVYDLAADWWWFDHLRSRRPAVLSFTMLNRLAELILRHRPLIQRALRRTYAFVFVDECQDTTYAQYDFLRSVFGVDGVVLTAVGDDKQRIMEWAGAVPDVFGLLKEDFKAERLQLLCNYRSSPELVQIQHVLARALDSSVEEARSLQSPAIDKSRAARIWCFDSPQREAQHIAECVSGDLVQRSLGPRDYGLLVRQKAEDFEPLLVQEFAKLGQRVRNEARRVGRTTIQDLMVEPMVGVYLGLLRLAARARDHNSWPVVTEMMRDLRGSDLDNAAANHAIDRQIAAFVKRLRVRLSNAPVDDPTCFDLLKMLDDFVDLEDMARVIPAYRAGDSLSVVREAMEIHLIESAASRQSWIDAFDAFEGVHCVPLMTVHKSKGLEFDTMVLIGLDDKTWWSYDPARSDGLATFFVAVSRAKQRVVITHCSSRGRRAHVAPLFDLLRAAGVPEFDLTIARRIQSS